MTSTVPPLIARKPALFLRVLANVWPAMRTMTEQVYDYTAWWDGQNQEAAGGDGPLLVAIGDSTAIGIGASRPDRGYVGVLQRSLSERDQTPWRVINLGLSGARVADALDRQLPILARLRPDVVTCCIGINDLVWTRQTTRLRDRLRQLIAELPEESIVARLAGGSARGRLANNALRDAAALRAIPLVNPWTERGEPGRRRVGGDLFHPNDYGYELMARPFGRQLGIAYPGDAERSHSTG